MSGAVSPSPSPFSGSLLTPVTTSEPGASPDLESLTVTEATVTSLWSGGHRVQPAAGRPAITGRALSMRTVTVFGASWLPARSTAKYVRVVVPSAEMSAAASAPGITWLPLSAPLRAKWISLTPEPPLSSVAVSATLTAARFQPAAFGGGDTDAVVTGGMPSPVTVTIAKLRVPTVGNDDSMPSSTTRVAM